jgi:antitoxin HigA-1
MENLKRKPTHPGNILKEEFLIPLGITQTELAHRLNTNYRTINEIVNEKRSISLEMAIKLSKIFNTSIQLWLNLQNQYDIYHLMIQKQSQFDKIKFFRSKDKIEKATV